MIRISVAGDERYLSEADPDWVTQQIERRRRDGLPVCVAVEISTGEVDMCLSTPECGGRGGGGGSGRTTPNAKEASIQEVWARMGLSGSGWTPGSVVAFLNRLRSLV